MDIEEARAEIAAIDREMAGLFERRMTAAESVAAWKKERGLPILDKAQEDRVLERNSALVSDPKKRELYLSFQREVMRLSRRFQHRLIEGARVSYSGVEGAFAQIAAARIFPDAQLVACPSFDAAYQAVVSGDCASAVLPIENSYAGEVGQVMDLMFDGPLHVNGVYDMAIDHCLLGTSGAALSDVRTVISHPQALSQCHAYLLQHGMEAQGVSNTAIAAQTVANAGDKSLAAIASAETAALYGLRILDHHINESRANTTRFAVFSAVDAAGRSEGGAFLLLFTVNDEAGGLAKAINVIGAHGFNMRVLRSRPMRKLPWHYYFYVEIEGSDASEGGKQLLRDLRGVCQTIKVAGRYTSTDNALQGGESI